jgi:hypothetical protein
MQEGNTAPHFWAETDKKWSWLDKEYQPHLAKIQADPQMLLADASESTYAYYASASKCYTRAWYAAHLPVKIAACTTGCTCNCLGGGVQASQLFTTLVCTPHTAP